MARLSPPREAEEHPDEVATAAYLDGSLGLAERDALEAHLAACDPCRGGVGILREAARAGRQEPPSEYLDLARRRTARGRPSAEPGRRPPAPPERVPPPAAWALGAAAASAILVAGIALWFPRAGAPPAPGGSPIYRAGPDGASLALAPEPGSEVAPGELVFRWAAVAGADRYVVTLLGPGADRMTSLEAPAPATSAAWPEDRPRPAPGAYVFKVRALSLDRAVAESPPIPFRIR
jgi:hypothetical protein